MSIKKPEGGVFAEGLSVSGRMCAGSGRMNDVNAGGGRVSCLEQNAAQGKTTLPEVRLGPMTLARGRIAPGRLL